MADRVVILGPIRTRMAAIPPSAEMVVLTAEVSPMDGETLLQAGQWRVALARYSGPLADATVLRRTWEAEPDEFSARSRKEDGDWAAVVRICGATVVEIPTPLRLAA